MFEIWYRFTIQSKICINNSIVLTKLLFSNMRPQSVFLYFCANNN